MNYELFAKIVNIYHGSTSCQFRQSDYLSDFSGIKAKRLSSDRATVVYGNFSGDEGLCLGFTLLMIEKYFNFGGFLSALKTTEGKGKVRGYSFIQHMRSMTKTGKREADAPIYENVDEGGRCLRLVANKSEAASFALAKDFDKMGSVRSYATTDLTGLAPFIQVMTNSYFFLSVYGVDSGHAVALVNTEDNLGVFDPNYGMATFHKGRSGGTNNFCHFLNMYMFLIYLEEFSHGYHITAFKSKTRPIATMRIT